MAMALPERRTRRDRLQFAHLRQCAAGGHAWYRPVTSTESGRDTMNRLARSVSFGALMLLVSVSALAQATAQMAGTVRDESGAVLPGVTVTVTQTDTGFTRTVVTEGSGGYAIPNLPTGPYKLEASLQGFKTYAQTRYCAAGRRDTHHQRRARRRQPGRDSRG